MGLRGPKPKSAAELKLRGSTLWKQRLAEERQRERGDQPSKPLAQVPALTDQIRLAVHSWGGSLAAIAADSGISPSGLRRFMAGRGGLSVDGLERLCHHLDLAIYNVLVDRCYCVDTQRAGAAFRPGDLHRVLTDDTAEIAAACCTGLTPHGAATTDIGH